VGRVLFASKSEPAIDWCEIESRLHESVADDQPVANDPLVTSDLPVSNFGDPLVMLQPVLKPFASKRLQEAS
jgi:hypothetical protein